MAQTFADLSAALAATGKLNDEDTLAVRRLVWPDGAIAPSEADEIFRLNAACADRSRVWVDFFVEALTHFIVRQVAPIGYVSDTQAAWLIEHIDQDGKLDSLAELELLAKIMETAINVPDVLKNYALRQIEHAVMTGTGPTRTGGTYTPGVIDPMEVTLLRRILFAQAGEGASIIAREEAELLFRLKDATLGADNAAGWPQLFVQAVGNHLMAHSDYHALDFKQAVEMDRFMSDTHVSVGTFFGRMASSLTGGQIGKLFGKKRIETAEDHEAKVAGFSTITGEEAAWLKAKISVDDQLDELEKALLNFIVEESASLPEELAALQQSA
jgi:hypothetical protein